VRGENADRHVRATAWRKAVFAGVGVTFTPRGTHSLKGIDGSWELYAV
jgi:hypothetical protein